MAVFYQVQQKYKVSWVQVMFKNKFGDWPNDLLKQAKPIESTQEFIDWVKSDRADGFKKQGDAIILQEQKKLLSLARMLPRKGKTAKQLAEKFGISERTVRTYTSEPRDQYLAASFSLHKPWEALGMSRATWYRHGKPDPKTENKEH